jgi:GAF domain-containing protein
MSSPELRLGDPRAAETLAALADLTERLGRCGDLDDVLTTSLESLDSLFGLRYSMYLMLDETGSSLYTIASHGYDRAGIGSEVRMGEGIIGAVASQRRPMRIGNLRHMIGYGRAIQESINPGGATEIALPGLMTPGSQLGAPSMVANRLLGVLAVESEQVGAFTALDENLLTVVAHIIASAIEIDRVAGGTGPAPDAAPPNVVTDDVNRTGSVSVVTLRYFPADGSTFIDSEYLIKGVAGRILWRLLKDHQEDGRTEFTNREVRLDRTLELPAYRDNLESRLVLLQRRLDEREAPVRIQKTGRGRFRLELVSALELIEQND